MKNILRKATLFALLLGTLSTNATVTKNDTDATIVRFGFVKEGAQIFIKDAEDYLLHEINVEQTGHYIKSFDLTTLPNGVYRFEIHDEQTIQIKPFHINKGVAVFDETSDYTFFKPVITPFDNKVTLTCTTLNNDPFEVKIYDDQDRLLYKEKITEAESLKRIYNLSQVLDQDIVFKVKVGNRRFSERIAFSN